MIQKIKIFIFVLLYCIFGRLNKETNKLTILTYHKVTDIPDFQDSLKISVDTFENQMRYLKKHYYIISGNQLEYIFRNKLKFNKNSLLITFDDGWLDNYTHAFPILKKYGIPAIIFICTDYIGTNKVFWHEHLTEIMMQIPLRKWKINKYQCFLNERIGKQLEKIIRYAPEQRRPHIDMLIEKLKSYNKKEIASLIEIMVQYFGLESKEKYASILNWEQIREMIKYNVSFGSHTKSHAILTNINNDEIVEELAESKKIIEKNTESKVYFVAYPNGNFNKTIMGITERLNYLAGFTCNFGKNDESDNLFSLKRKHIHESLSLDLRGKFSDLYFKADMSNIRKNFIELIKNTST